MLPLLLALQTTRYEHSFVPERTTKYSVKLMQGDGLNSVTFKVPLLVTERSVEKNGDTVRTFAFGRGTVGDEVETAPIEGEEMTITMSPLGRVTKLKAKKGTAYTFVPLAWLLPSKPVAKGDKAVAADYPDPMDTGRSIVPATFENLDDTDATARLRTVVEHGEGLSHTTDLVFDKVLGGLKASVMTLKMKGIDVLVEISPRA